MPKRDDIKSILIIGAGPIIIGQACEFDYSGTQAARALKEEGYKIILVNSNPATIMTDPEIADRTYIEPITVDYVSKIISKENPDAILPTVGGQTALNLAIELNDKGILKKYNVELIGAQIDAIQKAEDREKFKEAMESVGINTAKEIITLANISSETRTNDLTTEQTVALRKILEESDLQLDEIGRWICKNCSLQSQDQGNGQWSLGKPWVCMGICETTYMLCRPCVFNVGGTGMADLWMAAKLGNFSIMEDLLAEGHDPNQKKELTTAINLLMHI